MKNLKKKKNLKKLKKVNFKKKLRKYIQTNLVKHLGWKKSTAIFISYVICGILAINGVWHKKLVQTNEGNPESDKRRVQRFFAKYYLNYYCISKMFFGMLNIQGKVTILIDRTNWDYGKSHINIFVAAALYKDKNCSQSFPVPLVWEVFDKAGTSNTNERKQLIHKLFDVVGKDNIQMILGDREFIGKEWIEFLHKNNIPFIFRIKQNKFVELDGQKIQPMELFAKIKYKEKLKYNVIIDDVPVQLVATRSVNKELVVVIASMSILDDPLDNYRLRWLIELFFKSIKSKGFNLEDTHMTDPERIKALFFLIAFSTLLSVQAGIFKNYFKKIKIKKHGRPAYSLFTYGLDFIKELFQNAKIFTKILREIITTPPKSLTQKNVFFALGKG